MYICISICMAADSHLTPSSGRSMSPIYLIVSGQVSEEGTSGVAKPVSTPASI